jgi:phosphate transport system permease protein
VNRAAVASRDVRGPRAVGDGVFFGATRGFAAVVLALPVIMVVELLVASRASLFALGPGFFASAAWDPVHGHFGALPFLFGTVVSSALALAIAGPVSIGVAIALAEILPPRVARPLGRLVELLAAVPSVVYGFWGLFVLVPLLREHVEPALAAALGFTPMFQGAPLGFGMLAAGVVLAIMIVPTISSVAREVLVAVPAIHREAALGLGATRWDAIRVAVLPSARSGLVGAVLLGLGRALGETMAVAMVIGNRPKISASLFDPACTMASAIANEFAEADTDLHLAALSELALTLLGAALAANLLARWLVARAEASAASPTSGTPSSDRAPRFVPRTDRSAA